MSVQAFLSGAICMACFAIGLVFLRYWRVSKDPFFIWFAAAFWCFSIGWALKLVGPSYQEHSHYLYVPRLIGFLLILTAIVAKNRRTSD
jgi:multidrug efflux pump subunit AcrB